MKQFVWFLLLVTPLAIGLLSLLLPRQYNSPLPPARSNTQYWPTSTGDSIAYLQIPANPQATPAFPILYLHGGPGGRVTDHLIETLRPLANAGHDLYFYDQIGSGFSSRLANIQAYHLQRHQEDLAAIIKAIGAEQVILIGHSWGAILATTFLAQHPQLVAQLILTGPGPLPPIRYELAMEKAPDSLNLQAPPFSNRQGNARAHNWRSKAMRFYALHFGRKLATDREADDFASYWFTQLNRSTVQDTALMPKPYSGAGFYAHLMTLQSLENQSQKVRPMLRQLPTPVLVMKGQYDNQKWGFTAEYLELLRNSELVVIPNAGHAIEVEQGALYLEHIQRFLAEQY